ncbi:MAG: MFS transporter [Breznakibacter sp.]
MSTEKLKLKEKIGYGLGDAASSMFWKLFSMYLLIFYTDVFGLPAATVGFMFLITRLWDAAFDPVVGVIADRTQTRWGKFRPYLLWMALPFGIVGIFTFTTPEFSVSGKLWYAYITYSLMMMVYSLINVPYASLLGVMSANPKERTTLASYRMVFAFAGSVLVLGTFQPLFDTFGSRKLGGYPGHAGAFNDSTWVSPVQKGIAWENGFPAASLEGVNDTLVFLSTKIKTKSDNALKLGLYDSRTNRYAYFEFPQGTDTLGLKRDGTWGEVKLNLSRLNHTMPMASELKVVAISGNIDDFSFKRMEVKEVDQQSGTQKAVIVVAVLAVIFFFLTFSWTRERVKPALSESSSLKNDLTDLLKNVPWFILLGAGVSALIFNSIRDGAAVYYFKYFIQNEDAVDMSLMGLVLPVTYSTLYLVLGQAANIVGVVLAKPVSDKIGKRPTFLYAMLLASVMSVIFFFFDRSSIVLIFVFQFLISICAGIIFPLLWSMYADIADFSEWKTGRRATGLIFSSSSMSQKFGWTLGGAVTAWLLGMYGFKANMVQTEQTQTAIRMMLSIFPAIGALLSVVFVYTYKLSDKFMEQVTSELNERRKDQ